MSGVNVDQLLNAREPSRIASQVFDSSYDPEVSRPCDFLIEKLELQSNYDEDDSFTVGQKNQNNQLLWYSSLPMVLTHRYRYTRTHRHTPQTHTPQTHPSLAHWEATFWFVLL